MTKKPDYEETIEEEADRETDCESSPEKTVPIATTYDDMVQLALISRRGELMKSAKPFLPKPENCTEADIPTLCQSIERLNSMVGELISLVGEKENKLTRAMEAHEIITESFENWQDSLDSIRGQLVSARSSHKEARKTHQEFIEEIESLP